MTHTVTLIPGDSIGREVVEATRRLVGAAGVAIEWDEVDAGETAWNRQGDALPEETVASVRRNRVALKGLIGTPVGTGYESPNVRLRKALDLFAGVRPIRHLPGLSSRYDDVDLVVVRESTEDVYAGIEHRVYPGVIQGLKVTTRAACERIVRFAFEYARRHGRRTVTLVHKANIMKQSDGLFLRVGEEIAADYDDVDFDSIIADNACMQLVRRPERFDVLVSQNLFGDLLSDLGAGLVGGVSAAWGVLRDASDVHVFEAIHGVEPHLAGRDVANPLTCITPALGLLRHLGEDEAATRIEGAIRGTLEAGVRTRDLGGSAGTREMTDAIIARL
ncbi:MAG: isocitrate/isopropylmalate dehydrogenase family protein [Myxococcota bacterium]